MSSPPLFLTYLSVDSLYDSSQTHSQNQLQTHNQVDSARPMAESTHTEVLQPPHQSLLSTSESDNESEMKWSEALHEWRDEMSVNELNEPVKTASAIIISSSQSQNKCSVEVGLDFTPNNNVNSSVNKAGTEEIQEKLKLTADLTVDGNSSSQTFFTATSSSTSPIVTPSIWPTRIRSQAFTDFFPQINLTSNANETASTNSTLIDSTISTDTGLNSPTSVDDATFYSTSQPTTNTLPVLHPRPKTSTSIHDTSSSATSSSATSSSATSLTNSSSFPSSQPTVSSVKRKFSTIIPSKTPQQKSSTGEHEVGLSQSNRNKIRANETKVPSNGHTSTITTVKSTSKTTPSRFSCSALLPVNHTHQKFQFLAQTETYIVQRLIQNQAFHPSNLSLLRNSIIENALTHPALYDALNDPIASITDSQFTGSTSRRQHLILIYKLQQAKEEIQSHEETIAELKTQLQQCRESQAELLNSMSAANEKQREEIEQHKAEFRENSAGWRKIHDLQDEEIEENNNEDEEYE